MDKGYRTITIDAEFKALILPLRREEYAQLEGKLILDGCRRPIITWKGILLDGHNRYEICNRLHIPYGVEEIALNSREDAICWICSNQLGRTNITEETRRYLMGRQYEAEKVVGLRKNKGRHNQHTKSDGGNNIDNFHDISGRERRESAWRTANRLGKKYHVSSCAVQKYGKYSTALDLIAQKAPELALQILSGKYKISQDNVVALSTMETKEVQTISKKVGHGSAPFIRYSESRKNFTDAPAKKPGPKATELPAIKTMPAFDPDAEVTVLTLTIPSWTSSIDRTRAAANLRCVSPSAKMQLEAALLSLQHKAQEMIRIIKEDT